MSEALESVVSGEDFPPPQPELPHALSQGKCRCGCVPNILSLFEMAELRVKYRKAKQEALAAATAAATAAARAPTEEETKAP